MQKFYRDKSKLFECNISVDGAKINETKARLVLEFPNERHLLFHGKIDKNGKCEILIPPLNEMEECEGSALLEIIAEQTYFESWRDDFTLATNKKVVVEVFNEGKPIIENRGIPKVSIITESVVDEIIVVDEHVNFKQFITESNIDYDSAIKNKRKYLNMLVEYKKNSGLSTKDILELHKSIVGGKLFI